MEDEPTYLRLSQVPQASSVESEVPDEVTAESVGRYRPSPEELGRGGIGRVYVAFDQHLGRNVAIKELLTDPLGVSGSHALEDRARFLREARVTGQLEHPGIVPVYELGKRPDGTLYYAMKLVRGRTLRQVLKDSETLPDRMKLLSHFRDLANAIAYAHSRGVVHRDIKPDNVMVGEFGRTVVLDWGLTKVKGERDMVFDTRHPRVELPDDARDSNTRYGAIMGTPAYMSPEQAQGDLPRIDERSDVWSLGAVLFELLTGKPPFGTQRPSEVLINVVEGDAPSVTELEPAAPPDLAAIADKALSKDPKDRYANASEMVTDLEAFMAGRRVAAYDYTAAELVQKFVREHRTAALASAAVVGAILVGALLAVMGYRQALIERENARASERQAVQAKADSDASRRQANLHLASALVEQSRLLARTRNTGAAGVYAAAAALHSPWNDSSPHRYPDLNARSERERADALLPIRSALYWSLVQRHLVLDWRQDSQVCAVAVDPGGRFAAVAEPTGQIVEWDLDRKAQGRVWVVEGCPRYLALAGGRVAYALDQGPVRIQGAGGETRTLRSRSPDHRGLVLDGEGETLFVAGSDDEVLKVDLTDLSVQARARVKAPRSLGLSPDGETLVVGTRWGEVAVLGTQDLVLRARHDDHGSVVWAVAFSSDGARYATAGFEGPVVVRDATGIVARLPGQEPVKGLAFSASPDRLVSAGFGLGRLWSVPDRRIVQAFSRSPKGVQDVMAAGKDRILSVEFGRGFSTWRLGGASAARRLSNHDGPVYGVVEVGDDVVTTDAQGRLRWWGPRGLLWSAVEPTAWGLTADGQGRVYTVTSRGRVKVWDRDGSAAILQDNLPSRTGSHIAIHSNGNTVVWVGRSGEAVLYDVRRDQIVGRVGGMPGQVTAVVLSADGSQVAAADDTGALRVWNTEGQVKAWSRQAHAGIVTGLAFAPDGRHLASAGKDAAVRLWSADGGEPRGELLRHQNWVNQVVYSPDGRYLLSSSDDETALLWDVERRLPRLELPARTQVIGVAFGDGGRRMWIGLDDAVWGLPTELPAVDLPAETLVEDAEQATGLRVAGFDLKALPADASPPTPR